MSLNATIKNTKYFLIYSCCVFFVGLFITYLVNPNILETVDLVSNKVDVNLLKIEGIEKLQGYLMSNGIKVPCQMLVLAFLPIPFLYCINITITAVLPAILIGIMLRYDVSKAILISVSALPHFCIEIIAYCLLASCLYRLNVSIYHKFYAKFSKNTAQILTVTFQKALSNTVKCYLFLVIPCIILAGIFETFFANLIFNG